MNKKMDKENIFFFQINIDLLKIVFIIKKIKNQQHVIQNYIKPFYFHFIIIRKSVKEIDYDKCWLYYNLVVNDLLKKTQLFGKCYVYFWQN